MGQYSSYQITLFIVYSQKRIVRIITRSNYQTHPRPFFFWQLNILYVYQLNEYMFGVLICKHDDTELAMAVSNMFIRNSKIHNSNTRCKNKSQRWKVDSKFASYSCRQQALVIWDSLSNDVTSISFYNSFKHNLKQFLIIRDSHWIYVSGSPLFAFLLLSSFLSYHVVCWVRFVQNAIS